MSDMNGVELFHSITTLRRTTLGIFVTAHTGLDTMFPAIDAGIMKVLAKPIDVNALLGVVEQLIGPPEVDGSIPVTHFAAPFRATWR